MRIHGDVCFHSSYSVLWLVAVYLLTGTQVKRVSCDLSDRLHSYEFLDYSDLIGASTSREKRYTHEHRDSTHAMEHLSFTTLGRKFNLLLTENKELFGKDFSVKIIKGDGQEVEAPFSPQRFYTGIVLGEANTDVSLHWDTDRAINAKIVTRDETYYVEPSQGHVFAPKSHNHTMIAYKGSDIKMHFHNKHRDIFGGVKHKSAQLHQQQVNYTQATPADNPFTVKLEEEAKERRKRQADSTERNTCGMLVVIDYRFLSKIMDGDSARASNYVVDLIARVNKIYRGSSFGSYSGFGFQIEQIKIHDNPSSDKDHYNYGERRTSAASESEPNPVNVLLDAFGRVDKTGNTDYTKFCLAHLFTAYAFENGVLGLAYIASSSRQTYGGICSKSFYDSSISAQVYLNTGWSSAFNRKSEKILTQEAEIVLAHELGHNWGSEHDPDTRECSPSDVSGGKYIMYTYSVSGFDQNNKEFSTCSKTSIGQVLASKADLCFKEMSSPTRGNFKKDGDEECDAGLEGDKCCTSEQKLTPGSDCSITNHVCCKDCRISNSRGLPCATESELSCIANSFCSGTEPTCKLLYKEPGDYCQGQEGRCVKEKNDTICRSFAHVIGLDKCPCPEEGDICKLCHRVGGECQLFVTSKWTDHVTQCNDSTDTSVKVCSNTTGIPLKPYDISKLNTDTDGYLILEDSSCEEGYCNSVGQCVRQSTDIVARFWDFLNDLTFNAVVEFMESNIAGTVAVFSFILWLPCVIAVYCYDKKQAKRAKLQDQTFRSLRRYQVEDRRMISRPQLH